jgi:hypothetical protein
MIQDKLSEIAKKYGVNSAVKAVGGLERYVKLMHNGDLKSFYEQSKLLPYKMSTDRMSLYIDDLIVQLHGFEDRTFSSIRESKHLGDFRYGTKCYLSYRFTAEIHPMKMENGQKMWRVVGTSGDSGFGYRFIAQKNTLGIRHRTQIYNQIIDRFNLTDYLQ